MVSTLKRQLTEDEKTIILQRFGRTCFANGHTIADDDQLQFDHIFAHGLGGESELNNIAPMCAHHNKEKGVLSLGDFRTKLKLNEFFSLFDKPTLRDLLDFLKKRGEIQNFGSTLHLSAEASKATVQSPFSTNTYDLYICPTTKWRYFYATVPVSLLDSDDDEENSVGLQPRYLIEDKVFSLFRHFQKHPVLQPAIGRLAKSKFWLFDGQHKSAALLLNGRQEIECKIYLDPDLNLLNNTNIAAHDAFAQTRFYSSIMVLKLGAEFAREFEGFKADTAYNKKSEKEFFQYLAKGNVNFTKGEINRRFRSHLYSSVLNDDHNKLDAFVSKSNRGTDKEPITIDMLEKSLFSHFLYREPTDETMTGDAYLRDDEVRNLVALCNFLVEEGLCNWDSGASAGDATRVKLRRLFGSKSMMSWSELLWDAICARLEIYDGDERQRVFYRVLQPSELDKIRQTVRRLFAWQRWDAPDTDTIDRVLSDNKSAVKEWFKANGLTTGYLMGAST
ncbi:hypothetical protein ACC785_10590 [Rhizobium ruizarguesonis]